MLRKLSDDQRATVRSAMVWSIAAIMLIVAAIPATLYAAEGLQDLSKDESYFEVDDPTDMLNSACAGGINRYDGEVVYEYENSTGVNHGVSISPYYQNETGNDYNEVLLQQSSTDNGAVDDTAQQSITLQVNQTTQDHINNDITKVKLSVEIERNSTVSLNLEQNDGTYSDPSPYDYNTNDYNMTTNMTTYSQDISYSKILDSDSLLPEENQLTLLLRNLSGGAFMPGDSLKFNIDLVHSTSAVSTFWTLNTVAGITGIFVFTAAIFSTPYVDLKDLTGGR